MLVSVNAKPLLAISDWRAEYCLEFVGLNRCFGGAGEGRFAGPLLAPDGTSGCGPYSLDIRSVSQCALHLLSFTS